MKKLALTIRTAIERGLTRFKLPGEENVVRLLLMISAHESGGFTYCKQKGGPPWDFSKWNRPPLLL